MSSKVVKKPVYTKTTTYLTEKTKKILTKLAKSEGKTMYEVVNEAVAFYATSCSNAKK